MVQSAVNAWLKDKSYQIVDITHAIQKRVDNWRYVTWQIYDNIAATTSPSSGEGLQETRLKQDVYRNRFDEVYKGPGDNFFGTLSASRPEIYPIYWSQAQMQARQSEEMANAQSFLNRLNG